MARRWSSAERGYGTVLGLIAVIYLASVWFDSGRIEAIVVVIQLIALRQVFEVSHARKAVIRVTDITLACTAIAVASVQLIHPDIAKRSGTELVILYISAILFGIAPLSMIRNTLGRARVDTQTLLAAIAAYLMLGMFFAFAYRAVAATQSAPFFGTSGIGNVADDLFFSFITLTTTGYGNLVPAGNPGQTMAVVEAIVGQLFLVTAVAKIVNESGVFTRLKTGGAATDPGTDASADADAD